ncbi:MAG: glutamine amidotransferase [Micrococcaceae bacterium]
MSENKGTLNIVQIYPKHMNIYGDYGNTLAVQRRAEAHGYKVNISDYNVGDTFPKDADIILGGGGQDSGQSKIYEDLLSHVDDFKNLVNNDTPILVICGLYQLFGNYFRTNTGEKLEGIGILDAETNADATRRIGNIVVNSKEFGDIVGYENHSGQTFLGKNVKPLGTTKPGEGNNGEDKTEGARYKNVIASYLHGSILPKNPKITDFLIEKAAINKFGKFEPAKLDDSIVEKARKTAISRPR